MKHLFDKIICFGRREQGIALIEFAFVIPALIILMVAGIELSNFIYANQKVQNAAANIANIVNLQNDVSTTQLEAISEMLPRIVRPFNVNGGYQVIVTAMQRDDDIRYGYVRWQKSFGTAGRSSKFSYSSAGNRASNRVNPSDLDGFTFAAGDQVIIVETFLFYQPLLNMRLMRRVLGLSDSFLYQVTPPLRPRSGSFQFDPDDLV